MDSTNASTETWKDIPGFTGYQVSGVGRVRSFWKQRGWTHQYFICDTGKIMAVRSDKAGRPFVTMRQNGRTITRMVHRLEMLAFCGPCPEGHEVCHNNGNASDNSLTNLRYDTPKNNHNDKRKHGTMPRGESHYKAKLTAQSVRDIRLRSANGERPSALAREYGVDPSCISEIVYRRNWRHI